MLRVQEMEEAWALTVISHTAPSHSQLQLLSYDKAVSCDNYFRPFRTSFIEIHTPDRERLCSIGTEGTCRCVRVDSGDNINTFFKRPQLFTPPAYARTDPGIWPHTCIVWQIAKPALVTKRCLFITTTTSHRNPHPVAYLVTPVAM